MEGSPPLILPVLFKLNEMLTFSRDDATQTLGNPNVTTGNAMLLQFPVRAVKSRSEQPRQFIRLHRNGETGQNEMISHLTEIGMESHLTETTSGWPLHGPQGTLKIKSKRSAESRRSPSCDGLLELPIEFLTDRHKYRRLGIEYIETIKERRIC